MIAKLTGKVDQTGEGFVVIDVNGVGYIVFCSNRTLSILADKIGVISVIVETHVREDHIHLYGFADEIEQLCFRLLLTVQGVGAKVCLGILSALSPDNLMQAITAQDQTIITRAPGVGPKLATRIISELKDKIGNITVNFSETAELGYEIDKSDKKEFVEDAVSALVNLGYGRSEVFRAVHQVLAKVAHNPSVEELIKKGLSELSSDG
jgi:Holliday junction DNA helicase RuvA